MIRIVLASTLAALLLLHAAAAGAQDEPPERRASVGVRVPRATLFVGEVVPVTLEIAYDEAWFEAHATPLVRRAMDLRVRAVVPAFLPREDLGRMPQLPAAEGTQGVSFALGDDVQWGTLLAPATGSGNAGPEGVSPRSVISLTRRFRVATPGILSLAAPTLEFAWAERFESDLLGEPSPVNAQRVIVHGAPLELTARNVPSEGRPEEYGGLIGRYTLSASVDRRELSAGEPLRLTLALVGQGNHETLPLPAISGLAAFHLLGTLEEVAPEGRKLSLDLVPLDGQVGEVPALTLHFFDPERGAYDVARTQAIPLTVKGAVPPAPPPPEPPAVSELPQQSNWFLPALLALVMLAGVCAWLWKRSLRPSGTPSATASLEPALARLRAAARAGDPHASGALLDVLAQHLKTAPAALVDANLASELEASGLPRALAERAAAAVEAGVAARYAGPDAAAAPLPPGLAEELEQALRTTRSA